MRKTYLKNLLLSYSPFLAHIGVTIAVVPYAVHSLGEFEYGFLVLFHTLLGYLALAHIGTPQAVIRRLIEFASEGNQEKADHLITSLFYFFLAIILLAGGLVVVIFTLDLFGISAQLTGTAAGADLLRRLSLPLFLIFAFDLLRQLFDTIIVAQNKIYLSKLLLALLIAARGLVMYGVLYRGGDIVAVLLGYAVLAGVAALTFYLVSRRELPFSLKPARLRWELIREILPDSFWYFGGGLAVVLIFQTDSLVISSALGVAAVTVYALMFRYVDVVARILANIVMVLFPTAAEMFSRKEYGKLLRLHDRLLGVMTLISIAIFGLFYLVGAPLFKLWMGDLALFDQQLFHVFLVTNCLMLITAPATNLLEAVGWHRFSTKLSLVQGGLNLTLSIILVRKYGTIGVALATLIAFLLTNFIGNIVYFRRKMRLLAGSG